MGRFIGYLLVAASAIGLTACGGGGGGGAPLTATAVITSQNAPEVAGAVIGAAATGQDLGDLGGLASPAGAPTGTVTVAEVNVGAPPTAEVTIGPEVTPCEGGSAKCPSRPPLPTR